MGKTDGVPMEIHRTKPSPGLTLSVIAEGPEVLIYKVARNGKHEGEGRMTLVENARHGSISRGPQVSRNTQAKLCM